VLVLFLLSSQIRRVAKLIIMSFDKQVYRITMTSFQQNTLTRQRNSL